MISRHMLLSSIPVSLLPYFHNKGADQTVCIVKIWRVVCDVSSHSFSGRSGPGQLGPVRKILLVRSGPEGPQFARSVGTLPETAIIL